jgi:hypothetical protein
MVALSGIGEHSPAIAVRATVPAPIDRGSAAQFLHIPFKRGSAGFAILLPCQGVSAMTSDLRKLALIALAVSGLAIGLLAATTATALAGVLVGL